MMYMMSLVQGLKAEDSVFDMGKIILSTLKKKNHTPIIKKEERFGGIDVKRDIYRRKWNAGTAA